ncbi:60S ribosomal protein L27-like [Microtus ochrogaster]|uniref:60S ribosomal protein L27-like n=1 Tax=Microtus ochrogaster TaxID=79684 RepID=A0ABM1AIC7_MICOH|nr:60S ribosomal protein L27-like [Microtus ochrogaster]
MQSCHRDGGTSNQPDSQALVAGIDHCFYRMTAVTTDLIAKRPKTKPSVKVCHYNLLMPTRSSVDIPFNKTVINKVVFRDSALKSKVS